MPATKLDKKQVKNLNSYTNTEIKTANYTAADKDRVLADSSGGAFNVTLPVGVEGMMIVVQDIGGAATTNNITVVGTINGNVNYSISDNYGNVELLFSDGDWIIVSKEPSGGGGGGGSFDVATQNEAISGVNNTKGMTPLRVRQAVEGKELNVVSTQFSVDSTGVTLTGNTLSDLPLGHNITEGSLLIFDIEKPRVNVQLVDFGTSNVVSPRVHFTQHPFNFPLLVVATLGPGDELTLGQHVTIVGGIYDGVDFYVSELATQDSPAMVGTPNTVDAYLMAETESDALSNLATKILTPNPPSFTTLPIQNNQTEPPYEEATTDQDSVISYVTGVTVDSATLVYTAGTGVWNLTTNITVQKPSSFTNGKLGVGTDSPSETFHVSGNSLLDGGLTVTGELDAPIMSLKKNMTVTSGVNPETVNNSKLSWTNGNEVASTPFVKRTVIPNFVSDILTETPADTTIIDIITTSNQTIGAVYYYVTNPGISNTYKCVLLRLNSDDTLTQLLKQELLVWDLTQPNTLIQVSPVFDDNDIYSLDILSFGIMYQPMFGTYNSIYIAMKAYTYNTVIDSAILQIDQNYFTTSQFIQTIDNQTSVDSINDTLTVTGISSTLNDPFFGGFREELCVIFIGDTPQGITPSTVYRVYNAVNDTFQLRDVLTNAVVDLDVGLAPGTYDVYSVASFSFALTGLKIYYRQNTTATITFNGGEIGVDTNFVSSTFTLTGYYSLNSDIKSYQGKLFTSKYNQISEKLSIEIYPLLSDAFNIESRSKNYVKISEYSSSTDVGQRHRKIYTLANSGGRLILIEGDSDVQGTPRQAKAVYDIGISIGDSFSTSHGRCILIGNKYLFFNEPQWTSTPFGLIDIIDKKMIIERDYTLSIGIAQDLQRHKFFASNISDTGVLSLVGQYDSNDEISIFSCFPQACIAESTTGVSSGNPVNVVLLGQSSSPFTSTGLKVYSPKGFPLSSTLLLENFSTAGPETDFEVGYILSANRMFFSPKYKNFTLLSGGSTSVTSDFTYSGTADLVTISGGTSPTGIANNQYFISKVGRQVVIDLNYSWITPGTGNTSVTIDLDADLIPASPLLNAYGSLITIHSASSSIGVVGISSGFSIEADFSAINISSIRVKIMYQSAE